MKTKKGNKKSSRKVRKAPLASVESENKNQNQKKLTRAESIVKALQVLKAASKREVIEKSDEIFHEAGGKSNLREAGFTAGHVLQALTAFGSIQAEKGIYEIK